MERALRLGVLVLYSDSRLMSSWFVVSPTPRPNFESRRLGTFRGVWFVRLPHSHLFCLIASKEVDVVCSVPLRFGAPMLAALPASTNTESRHF